MVITFNEAFLVRVYLLIEYITVNGRDKVICVNKLEANEVANKVSLSQGFCIWPHKELMLTLFHQVGLLLNSSGAKIKHLKNLTLEAAPGAESARGIWSALHDKTRDGKGYQI